LISDDTSLVYTTYNLDSIYKSIDSVITKQHIEIDHKISTKTMVATTSTTTIGCNSDINTSAMLKLNKYIFTADL